MACITRCPNLDQLVENPKIGSVNFSNHGVEPPHSGNRGAAQGVPQGRGHDEAHHQQCASRRRARVCHAPVQRIPAQCGPPRRLASAQPGQGAHAGQALRILRGPAGYPHLRQQPPGPAAAGAGRAQGARGSAESGQRLPGVQAGRQEGGDDPNDGFSQPRGLSMLLYSIFLCFFLFLHAPALYACNVLALCCRKRSSTKR